MPKPESGIKPHDTSTASDWSCLSKKIFALTAENYRVQTLIPELRVIRSDEVVKLSSYTLEPSICLIAQGRKEIIFGGKSYYYDPQNYLITSVDLPLIGGIIEATPEKPYLGLVLRINQEILTQLILENESLIAEKGGSTSAIAVNTLTPKLLSAFERLVNLLDDLESIPVLSPLIQKEIYYRLLTGEQSTRLKQIVSMDYQGYQVSHAVEWLKDNYVDSFTVGELAARCNMSVSAFHHHFRKVTTMTPLRFQKNLRLTEARRLMLMENFDAAGAAFEVGYESPSQFSREYSRLFGLPPLRDIKNLQSTLAEKSE